MYYARRCCMLFLYSLCSTFEDRFLIESNLRGPEFEQFKYLTRRPLIVKNVWTTKGYQMYSKSVTPALFPFTRPLTCTLATLLPRFVFYASSARVAIYTFVLMTRAGWARLTQWCWNWDGWMCEVSKRFVGIRGFFCNQVGTVVLQFWNKFKFVDLCNESLKCFMSVECMLARSFGMRRSGCQKDHLMNVEKIVARI